MDLTAKRVGGEVEHPQPRREGGREGAPERVPGEVDPLELLQPPDLRGDLAEKAEGGQGEVLELGEEPDRRGKLAGDPAPAREAGGHVEVDDAEVRIAGDPRPVAVVRADGVWRPTVEQPAGGDGVPEPEKRRSVLLLATSRRGRGRDGDGEQRQQKQQDGGGAPASGHHIRPAEGDGRAGGVGGRQWLVQQRSAGDDRRGERGRQTHMGKKRPGARAISGNSEGTEVIFFGLSPSVFGWCCWCRSPFRFLFCCFLRCTFLVASPVLRCPSTDNSSFVLPFFIFYYLLIVGRFLGMTVLPSERWVLFADEGGRGCRCLAERPCFWVLTRSCLPCSNFLWGCGWD